MDPERCTARTRQQRHGGGDGGEGPDGDAPHRGRADPGHVPRRSAVASRRAHLGLHRSRPVQDRTVDTVTAAMEANPPHPTMQKTLYVEISEARDRAELVTDDRNALRERLEAAIGERIAALEAVGRRSEKRAEGRNPSTAVPGRMAYRNRDAGAEEGHRLREIERET